MQKQTKKIPFLRYLTFTTLMNTMHVGKIFYNAPENKVVFYKGKEELSWARMQFNVRPTERVPRKNKFSLLLRGEPGIIAVWVSISTFRRFESIWDRRHFSFSSGMFLSLALSSWVRSARKQMQEYLNIQLLYFTNFPIVTFPFERERESVCFQLCCVSIFAV